LVNLTFKKGGGRKKLVDLVNRDRDVHNHNNTCCRGGGQHKGGQTSYRGGGWVDHVKMDTMVGKSAKVRLPGRENKKTREQQIGRQKRGQSTKTARQTMEEESGVWEPLRLGSGDNDPHWGTAENAKAG